MNSSSNLTIDLVTHHKLAQLMPNMSVCKHLFYHLMMKETFQYQQRNTNVCSLTFSKPQTGFIIIILGMLSPDGLHLVDSRDNLSGSKSAGDSASVEQTRREKFRHALRSVSKVAFSQLGLGMLDLKL